MTSRTRARPRPAQQRLPTPAVLPYRREVVRTRRSHACIEARLAAAALASVAIVASWPTVAKAEEPFTAGEPRLMSETAETTTVVDAFDRDNPFDLHISIGFRQQFKRARIRRETSLDQPGLSTGGFVASTENVASFSQQTSILEAGIDVGLYKDLALVARLPLIISDSRELSDLNGSAQARERRLDPNGQELFAVPFKSPTRSGFDWFSLGLAYAITNQRRDPSKPTWVIGADWRTAIGPRLHACSESAPVKCPDPANPSSSRDPGISRGMNGVVAHTTFSKRLGYVEPYIGLRGLLELPQSNSDFGATNDVKGSLLTRPPIVGTVTAGLEVIPWENRESFQRVVVDIRGRGSYHSPGRDYSEMFDALGSSQASTLRQPNPGQYRLGTDGRSSVPDPDPSKRVFFAGITDQEAFGSFGGTTQVTWQAGEYVKFSLGGGLTYTQPHVITSADACNPDFRSDLGASGPCRSQPSAGSQQVVTGIPNPNYRAVIDAPGRRYVVDDIFIVDLFVSGVVMF